MTVYYNEIDPFAAAWLGELMKRGLIADGEIDTRSIVDVRADDLKGFIRCHFFAGIGGWDYALQLAGWPSDRPVWTGSCPCQPFSLAGARQGFDDSRHLWPQFARLIKDASPATVFGEQVASATDWLGLVRGDLDAMGYAVGAMPIEAASAGADHLRDRFWFVADKSGSRSLPSAQSGIYRGEESPGSRDGEPERCGVLGNAAGKREREPNDEGNAFSASGQARGLFGGAGDYSGVGLADTDHARSQGRITERECADQRSIVPDGVAHADEPCTSEGRQQRSGEFCGAGGDTRACDGGDVANSSCSERWQTAEKRDDTHGPNTGWQETPSGHQLCGEKFEWVIGADGKARRVKSGLRLLAHGVPNRVGSLRGFGNAIDTRPASEFIQAFLEAEQELAATL